MIHEEKNTKLLEKSKQLSSKYYKKSNYKFSTKCKFNHSKDQVVTSPICQLNLDFFSKPSKYFNILSDLMNIE
jgi:hypothetical protein